MKLKILSPAALVLLAACSSPPPNGFSDVQSTVQNRSGLRVHWNQSLQDDATQSAVAALLQQNLTPDQAAQIALLNNPKLQVIFEDIGIRQADLVQAGLLKNPVFDISIRFPDRAPRGTYLNLSVAEDFLNVFFIPARRKLAQSQFEQAKAQVTDQVLTLVAETRQAFYVYQGAQQLVELRQSIADAADASAESATRLHDAGNITDLDFLNQRTQVSRARIDLDTAMADSADARERVTALMGLREDTHWNSTQKLNDLPADEIKPQGLETLAIRERSDLAALRQEVMANAQMLGLAKDTRWLSDGTAGVDAEHETDGQWRIGPSATIPIPLFDQGQAAIPKAQSMLRQMQQRYLAMEVDVRSQVRAAANRLLNARKKAQFLHDQVIPLQQQVVEQTQLQFNGMFVSLFQLLAARKDQFDAQREYIESLRDYWLARAELEKAVGGKLPNSLPPTTQGAIP